MLYCFFGPILSYVQNCMPLNFMYPKGQPLSFIKSTFNDTGSYISSYKTPCIRPNESRILDIMDALDLSGTKRLTENDMEKILGSFVLSFFSNAVENILRQVMTSHWKVKINYFQMNIHTIIT